MDNIIVPTIIIVTLAIFVLITQRSARKISPRNRLKSHPPPPPGVKIFSSGHVLHDPMSGKDTHRDMMKLITTTSNNRLKGLGDPIRGDLPIPPRKDGLYVPSANPKHTLRVGAVNIFPGNTHERHEKLHEIIATS
ncbi:hypothetical protein [Scale drop disease virus]|nr:hypothetical protein [Scale drop disease virus]QXJ13700.1 ORF110R [Scale drop disease virus]UNH60673.1 hypothetical protein SDDV_ORF004 [Scale drop disease virus]